MSAVLAILGSTVVTAIVSYLSEKGMKLGVAIGTLTLLFILIPFKLALPEEIYILFLSGDISSFFRNFSYFLPINFLITCILIIFASKYLKVFWNLIKFLWEKFID